MSSQKPTWKVIEEYIQRWPPAFTCSCVGVHTCICANTTQHNTHTSPAWLQLSKGMHTSYFRVFPVALRSSGDDQDLSKQVGWCLIRILKTLFLSTPSSKNIQNASISKPQLDRSEVEHRKPWRGKFTPQLTMWAVPRSKATWGGKTHLKQAGIWKLRSKRRMERLRRRNVTV